MADEKAWNGTWSLFIHLPFSSTKSPGQNWQFATRIHKQNLLPNLSTAFLVSQNIDDLKFTAFFNAWKKSPSFDGFSVFPFQIWWESIKIGQESHQLLVGIEVVRPGEIIARKDVLQKVRTKNGFRFGAWWMWWQKPPPKKTCGS